MGNAEEGVAKFGEGLAKLKAKRRLAVVGEAAPAPKKKVKKADKKEETMEEANGAIEGE